MYRVKVSRDETGAWIASVPRVAGCHTHGRSLGEVKRRIREALSLWVDDAERAELDLDVELPPGIRRRIDEARSSRREAERAAEAAWTASAKAVKELTERSGLSLRDAAELVGLSHQRVHQIASGS